MPTFNSALSSEFFNEVSSHGGTSWDRLAIWSLTLRILPWYKCAWVPKLAWVMKENEKHVEWFSGGLKFNQNNIPWCGPIIMHMKFI